jgi:hypothetical protein
VQQRHHLRRDAPSVRVHLRAHDNAAIELDDLGPQAEHAVEVRVARAEVVQRHQASQLAQRVDAAVEVGVVGQRRLQHLDHHLLRAHAVRRERVGDLADAGAGRRRERARVHVQEQPFVGTLASVGRQVLQQRRPIQAHAGLVAVDAGEQLQRRHRRAVGQQRGAQQRLVTYRAVVGQAVDRLEMRGEPVAGVVGSRGCGRCERTDVRLGRRVGDRIGEDGHRKRCKHGRARTAEWPLLMGNREEHVERAVDMNSAGGSSNPSIRTRIGQVEHNWRPAGAATSRRRAVFRAPGHRCNARAFGALGCQSCMRMRALMLVADSSRRGNSRLRISSGGMR